MSVHGATQMKCVVCDQTATLVQVRREWWLCTTCGSYLCPRCYTMFRNSGSESCPGTIVRGADSHAPHFSKFLAPRTTTQALLTPDKTTIVLLGDVPRPRSSAGRRVTLIEDVETEEANATDPMSDADES